MMSNEGDVDSMAPFIKKLEVDLDLKLTRKNIVESLKALAKNNLSNSEKLQLAPYPSVKLLALFAYVVYETPRKGENDREFEKRLGLPEEWKLLTIAKNTSKSNGYVGMAFWNPRSFQIVVAHCGTDLTNTGALYTDIMAIFFNKYAAQMASAATFADEIIRGVQEIWNMLGYSFQVSFTGHSLGGWLAQVTTFTTKYLTLDDSHFLRNENFTDNFHAHTVVFDSPGCETMLSKLKRDFDLRYASLIDFTRLDITSYLSAPNKVNTCNFHVGDIYRVFTTNLSKMSWLDKFVKYTFKAHSMKEILTVFHSDSCPVILKVKDWPVSKGLSGGEYKAFFKWSNHFNNYHPNQKEEEFSKKRKFRSIHYRTEAVDNQSCSLSVFTDDEIHLLQSWQKLKVEHIRPEKLNDLITALGLDIDGDLLGEFEMDDGVKNILVCRSADELSETIRHTKQLMRWFSEEVKGKLKLQIDEKSSTFLCKKESDYYLNSLVGKDMEFKDVVKLKEFLESCEAQVFIISSGNTLRDAAVFYSMFKYISIGTTSEAVQKYKQEKNHMFLNWEQILHLDKRLDIGRVVSDLLVLECPHDININRDGSVLDKLYKNSNEASSRKIIFIVSSRSNLQDYIQSLIQEPKVVKSCFGDIQSCWLSDRYKNTLLNQVNNRQMNITDLEVSHIKLRKHIEQNFLINYEHHMKERFDKEFLFVVTTKNLDTDRIKDSLLENYNEMQNQQGVVIDVVEDDGNFDFGKYCKQNHNKIVYWLTLLDGMITCHQIYDPDFYIHRKFICHHTVGKDIWKLFTLTEQREISDSFIFGGISNIEQLVQFLGVPKKFEHVILGNTHIKVATSIIDAKRIFRAEAGNTAHLISMEGSDSDRQLIWHSSKGSLDNLRKYVINDDSIMLAEEAFARSNFRVVIIADEPGMGKTTSLISLSSKMESSWVIRVDLKDSQERIKNLPSELSIALVVQFLLTDCVKSPLEDDMLAQLLKESLETATPRQVLLFFDGFDEVKDQSLLNGQQIDIQGKVIELLQFLKDNTLANVWVTTRKHLSRMLENNLSVFSTRFKELSNDEQTTYLKRFWLLTLGLEFKCERNDECDLPSILENYSAQLIQTAERIFDQEMSKFMGVPLQMRMLAEVLQPNISILEEPPEMYFDSHLDIFNVFDLYKNFISAKYSIYFNEKSGLAAGMTKAIEMWLEEILTKKYRNLGFQQVFPEDAIRFLGKKCLLINTSTQSEQYIQEMELNRVGLIQPNSIGEIQFIHFTFAEYFSADLLATWIRKEHGRHSKYPSVEEFLLTKVLIEPQYKVVRMFLNNHLSDAQLFSNPPVLFYDEYILEQWEQNRKQFLNNLGQTALHLSVAERNDRLTELLLENVSHRTEEATDEIVSFLTIRDASGETALYIAAKEKLVNFIEIFLNTLKFCCDSIQQRFLYTTVFKKAEDENVIFLLQCITTEGNYAPIKPLTDDVYEKVRMIPTFFAAVKTGNLDDVKKHLSKVGDDYSCYNLLLATDRNQCTPLHHAARKGSAEIMQLLLDQNAEISVLDKDGQQPIHTAAINGHLNIVKLLRQRGADIQARDAYGMSVVAYAAKNGHLDVLKYLVDEQRADVYVPDQNRINPLHHAAKSGHLVVVKYLMSKNVGLDIQDRFGMCAVFWAARTGHLDVVKHLVENNAKITGVDAHGMSILTIAIKASKWDIVKYLIALNQIDLNTVDDNGLTALDRVLKAGKKDVQEMLVERDALKALEVAGLAEDSM